MKALLTFRNYSFPTYKLKQLLNENQLQLIVNKINQVTKTWLHENNHINFNLIY